MDVEKLSIKELLAHGVKSEIEANEFYLALADSIQNFVVKDKLEYIADEEVKHEKMLRGIYKTVIGDDDIELPEESVVPAPSFDVSAEQPLSEWLRLAMESEEDASEFYKNMADKFDEDDVVYLLNYIASIEMGHYSLIKSEMDMADRFEGYDEVVPMIHIGA